MLTMILITQEEVLTFFGVRFGGGWESGQKVHPTSFSRVTSTNAEIRPLNPKVPTHF